MHIVNTGLIILLLRAKIILPVIGEGVCK